MRCKPLLTVSILALVGASTSVGTAAAGASPARPAASRTWFVSAAAASDPACAAASRANPFATIAAAVACAKSNDAIHVGAGHFAGGFTIASNITLAGSGANKTVVADTSIRNLPEIVVTDNHSVTIASLTVDGSTSSGPNNGGIFTGAGSLVLESVAVVNTYDNHAPLFAAVDVATGTGTSDVRVIDSTIANNLTGLGGGIYVPTAVPPNSGDPQSTLTVVNSTIVGNDNSAGFGGGIEATNTAITLVNDTIAGNSSQQSGVWVGQASSATLSNTLMAGNTGNGNHPDCARYPVGGVISGSHNLVGIDAASANSCGFTDGSAGNQVGTTSSPIDPKLGPLAGHGGHTQTDALLPTSPAIGAGSAAVCSGAPVEDIDQRAKPRHSTTRLGCDIGAYDTGGKGKQWFVSAAAGSDPACGAASKAQPFATIAAALACAHSNDVVHVGAGHFAGGFTITSNITLTGVVANKTTIADQTVRNLPEVTVADDHSVTIANLTVDGSTSSGPSNGGIFAGTGALALKGVAVANTFDSHAPLFAAVDVASAGAGTSEVTVANSTIANNLTGGGGGIYVPTQVPPGSGAPQSTLTVVNSTIVGNDNSAGFGGGINATNTAITLVNDTIAGNSSQESGLWVGTASSATVTNTILAGNSGAPNNPDCGRYPGGAGVSGSNDLIGIADTSSNSCGLVDGSAGNQVGTTSAPINPKLGALAINGGHTKTEALLPTSPAIGAADANVCSADPVNDLDQRAQPRHSATRFACDVGAYDTGGS